MAASRPTAPRLRAEVSPLTAQTPEQGTHSIRIFRGSTEIYRDLAANRAKAVEAGEELVQFFRNFARRLARQARSKGTP
jgi:vacuolar-type H+-ATPase subunit B/Vma2